METTLQQFSVLPSTREERTNFVTMAVNEICNGNENPLQIDATLKGVSDTIDEIRKNQRVKNAVQLEADKYPEKSFNFLNYVITKSTRTTNDFKGCDVVLDDLYLQQEKLKATIKAREATVLNGVDPATGETFLPPKSSTIEILSYKLK